MVPFPPKHRLTVFPETWFRALEPITGTSGIFVLYWDQYLVVKNLILTHFYAHAWFFTCKFLGGYLLAFGVLSVLVSKEFLIWPMVGLPQTWFVWFAIALFLLRCMFVSQIFEPEESFLVFKIQFLDRIQQQVYTNGMNYFAKHRKIIEDDLQMIQNFNKVNFFMRKFGWFPRSLLIKIYLQRA